MILTDSMLDAAFRFRETEAWKTLDDSNVFAVRLSDGQTVYCSIMGNGGEHHSLGIYIGENGFFYLSANIYGQRRLIYEQHAPGYLVRLHQLRLHAGKGHRGGCEESYTKICRQPRREDSKKTRMDRLHKTHTV